MSEKTNTAFRMGKAVQERAALMVRISELNAEVYHRQCALHNLREALTNVDALLSDLADEREDARIANVDGHGDEDD